MTVLYPITYNSQEDLQDLCAYWQTMLRLEDWDIQVSLVPLDEMSCTSHAGECWWNDQHKTATVRVMGEVDLRRKNKKDIGDSVPLSHELILVHELLHIHFMAWKPDPDSMEHTAQEQAINAVSKALVSLRHSEREE